METAGGRCVKLDVGQRIMYPDIYNTVQGRNLTGKVGLFPVSYTTPAPPTTPVFSSPNDGIESGVVHSGQKTVDTPEQTDYSLPETDTNHIIAPVPKITCTQLLNGSHHDFDVTNEPDPLPVVDQVMKATLTDVQKAIEQLGRNRSDNDGNRSFSFVSSQDDRGTDTDTDLDLSDLDSGIGGNDREDVLGWQKDARMKLAEKARKAVEEAKKLEVMMGGQGKASERRPAAPPIEVEMSDESEDEIEYEGYTTRTMPSAFQDIPEEDNENGLDVDGTSVSSPSKRLLPLKDEAQSETATATQTSFPVTSFPSKPAVAAGSYPAVENPELQPNTRHSTSSIQSTHNNCRDTKPENPTPDVEHARTTSLSLQGYTDASSSPRSSPVVVASSLPPLPRERPPPITVTVQSKHTSVASVKSHISSLHRDISSIPTSSLELTSLQDSSPDAIPLHQVNSIATNTIGSTAKTIDINATGAITATATTLVSPPLSAASPSSGPISTLPTPPPVVDEKTTKKEKVHPSDWVLEDVVEWLKSKGFDQDVCDKFVGTLSSPIISGLHSNVPFIIEQEITGDVLLELDANLLKTEIGIMAFGKRVRISNAIAELRRPPSISYSDHNVAGVEGPPMVLSTPITPQSQGHSRQQSQSYSHHSFTGSVSVQGVPGHQHSGSIQSSSGGPFGFTGSGYGLNGFGIMGHQSQSGGSQQSGGGFFSNLPISSEDSPLHDSVATGKADGEIGNINGIGLGISDSSGYLVCFVRYLPSCRFLIDVSRNLSRQILHSHLPTMYSNHLLQPVLSPPIPQDPEQMQLRTQELCPIAK